MAKTAPAKMNPAAAAIVFASLFTAALATPTATESTGNRAPSVTQQSQVQRDNVPQTQNSASSPLAQLQPADDPKRRRHYQRRNPFRQVRRRMERQGWELTGRQWRNLMKLANRLRLAGVA